MKETVRNFPYVKSFDSKGDLVNPILFSYKGLGPNRKSRRLDQGITSTRPFNNKKGVRLSITQIGPYEFMKFHKKIIKQGDTGTRLQYLEVKRTKTSK